MPGEEVRYISASAVTCGRTPFQVYVTEGRLLLHAIAGRFVKRERTVAENLSDLDFMQYTERGLFSRRGVLTIHFRRNTLSLAGEPDAIKELWRQLQTQRAATERVVVDEEQTLVVPPPPLFEDQPYPPAQVQPLSSAEPLPLEGTPRTASRLALIAGAVCLVVLAAAALTFVLIQKRDAREPRAAALPANTPSPTPAPSPVVLPIMDELFTLEEGSHRAVSFNVPAGQTSARIAGGFRVTSGSSVDFYLMSREQYERFMGGASPEVTSVVYREEQWNARVGERLPAGDYYLVFDLPDSDAGTQSVAAQFSVVFDQSASAH